MKFETKMTKLGIDENEVKSIIGACECGEINGAYFLDLSTMRKWEIMEMIGNHLDTDLYADGDFYKGTKRMSSFCKAFEIEESEIVELYREAFNEWGCDIAYTLESNKNVLLVLTDDERYHNSFIQYSPSQIEETVEESESPVFKEIENLDYKTNGEYTDIIEEKLKEDGFEFEEDTIVCEWIPSITSTEVVIAQIKASSIVYVDSKRFYAISQDEIGDYLVYSAKRYSSSKLADFIEGEISSSQNIINEVENMTENDDGIVEFKIVSKTDDRIYLNGSFDVSSYDEDTDLGDWEYEQNDGTMASHIPSYWKVNGENLSFEYDQFLDSIDWETFRQYLFDYANEERSIDCGDYILHINYGAFVDMEIMKYSNFEETFCATLLFRYNCELIEFDEDILKNLAESLSFDGEYRITSSSSIDLQLPRGFSAYADDYDAEESAEVISEMHETVREYFSMQLSRDAGLYSRFGENIEQNVEEDIASDREQMFSFKCASEDGKIGNWLFNNDYVEV